jgi:hypothetical protein
MYVPSDMTLDDSNEHFGGFIKRKLGVSGEEF